MEKYNEGTSIEILKKIPKELLKVVYDENDDVLFGSVYVKGKVSYIYIPAELMEENTPMVITTTISYDNIGNKDLPEGTEFVNFNTLRKRFPLNFPGYGSK